MTPRWRSPSRSAALSPSRRSRTSSVCSPSRGGGKRYVTGVSDSFNGLPMPSRVGSRRAHPGGRTPQPVARQLLVKVLRVHVGVLGRGGELAARRLEHTGDVSALELLHHPCL